MYYARHVFDLLKSDNMYLGLLFGTNLILGVLIVV